MADEQRKWFLRIPSYFEKISASGLPNFSPQTKVIFAGTDEYIEHAYQYATTSHQEDSMKPGAIIYPKSIPDIILAVNYARENDVGIAVRTGGHQYIG